MSPVCLGKFEPGSEAWEQNRRSTIGGSEIAAVLGISPWESLFSIWHRKKGMVEPFKGSPATEWGQRLEPVVAQKFLDEHDEVYAAPGGGWTFAHPDRPWQTATPDLMLRGHGQPRSFCEIKTAARADAWWDGVPVYYLTQVLWTMDVLSVKRAHVAALIGGSDYREYVVELDEQAEADLVLMREAGQRFIDSLEANEPPDIDGSYSTYQTIRKINPDIETGTEYEITRELAEAFCATSAELTAAKRAYETQRNNVARGMGRHHYAVCDGVRIARRQPTRDGIPGLWPTNKQLPPIIEGDAA